MIEVWADYNMFGEISYHFQPYQDWHRNGRLITNGGAHTIHRSEGMLARRIREYGYVRTKLASYEVVQ